MASRKTSFHSKPNSIFPTSSIGDNPIGSDGLFEFDEADIWSSSNPVAEQKKSAIPSYRELKKMGRKSTMLMSMADQKSSAKVTSASLPVNIPDWSNILKEAYKDQRQRDSDEDGGEEDFDGGDDDDDGGDGRVPPHEYLARTRGASFSVHEGIGRTLKGRDLRRVRNAIWKKVGFED
ncbi:uncharacterized protein Pyn_16062 [Prunus yedoensis var. nudiflora]|uniref:Senescence regulator n=2 Tax=Prunus yedoensis var. nudiflora TaxID=2094558 RepID=A0A314UQW0_PRUYE|nr:uncharacterized protein Pyn_16062 [Prunus yedoensis var. nudiflora]